uniref:Uncharacterized protein n=1 Tax=Heterosigma akashiwo TaxID=2829 RepID=A0A6S9ID06_HETAK|mmetsp:Transcript_2820/g.5252  ORF Transcript_2820/g.5252 Transcript_2820/m.5252 type:complete len:105 (+) Transcript_2820:106-420(+)
MFSASKTQMLRQIHTTVNSTVQKLHCLTILLMDVYTSRILLIALVLLIVGTPRKNIVEEEVFKWDDDGEDSDEGDGDDQDSDDDEGKDDSDEGGQDDQDSDEES